MLSNPMVIPEAIYKGAISASSQNPLFEFTEAMPAMMKAPPAAERMIAGVLLADALAEKYSAASSTINFLMLSVGANSNFFLNESIWALFLLLVAMKNMGMLPIVAKPDMVDNTR